MLREDGQSFENSEAEKMDLMLIVIQKELGILGSKTIMGPAK